MKKDTIIIIIAAVALIVGLISIGFSESESISKIFDFRLPTQHGHPEAIASGPLTLTQSQYKIGENIFVLVDNLRESEKGNIMFVVPDGRVYKTLAYDGSLKSSFNVYFKPDTSYLTQFCKQEEFIGEWTVKFENDAFPPLNFEIIDEHISGKDIKLNEAC